MNEEKKSKNPFINMANQAKNANPHKFDQKLKQKVPKSGKGFGAPSVTRRSGRGG
jgi:hypothetical protein